MTTIPIAESPSELGLVEVAVDAVGAAGGQTYTYRLPASLGDLVAGEAVLVEYGRRQALGVVVERHDRQPERETKPLLGRVRSDGPLLHPLQLQLALHVSRHYLAPPALVVRQMLPPGLLEKLELVTRIVPGTTADGELDELIAAAGEQGVVVEDLPRPAGRAALLRELHTRARDGQIELEWRLSAGRATVRQQRLVRLSAAGEVAARELQRGDAVGGRPLGARQQAALLELLGAAGAVASARLAERHSNGALNGLRRRGLIELETDVIERRPLADRQPTERGAMPPGETLTTEQAALVGRVAPLIAAGSHQAFLLEGSAASGKTAVYAALIATALAAGREALVLVPEISLAVPLLDRLRHDLQVEPALLHSALGEGERADEWRRIRAGAARVVVGTRLAVYAPLADPGLIVVDEEHDPAYKSERTPRGQARDLAIELGRLGGVPVVLGSATPDVVTVGRVEQRLIERLALPTRLAGRAPRVELVDLRAELAAGNRGLLSGALVAALAELDTSVGEQAILLINRRGSSSVVLCRDCGYVQVCPECQRPLVFHAAAMALRCHHCGASAPPARRCPACDSVRIRYLGGGTQRVEREVGLRFPDYRVLRLDRDVVVRHDAAAMVIDQFSSGGADVLVGTSLVAKGLDVPQVTLVGVVSADIALNLPDERAAERTYQLLAQAIGRAGRGDRPGRALIQTYQPDHPALQAAATGEAADFYRTELATRQLFRSPPFGSLIKLTVAEADRSAAEATAMRMVAELRVRAGELGATVDVLGPAPAYVARRGGRWRFNVVLRGDEPLTVLGGDPGPPWSVDVDPESLL